METKTDQQLRVVEKTGGQTRWIAITVLFLAIGVILRMVSPSVAGIMSNWLIAMYCLAILINKSGYKQALGIGLLAGFVSVATSKAIFPYANLVSEPAGALVCAFVAGLAARSQKLRFFTPALSTVLSTLTSGLVYITVTKFVMNIPLQVYLYAMLPVVLAVTGINCVITQVLYYPVLRLFAGKDARPPEQGQA